MAEVKIMFAALIVVDTLLAAYTFREKDYIDFVFAVIVLPFFFSAMCAI